MFCVNIAIIYFTKKLVVTYKYAQKETVIPTN